MYSKSYINQLEVLHNDKSRSYGFGGKIKKLGKFHSFMEKWRPKTLIDYGCGKGHILEDLITRYPDTVCEGYDPAVKEYNYQISNTYECLFSNDVLEHIEPEFLNDVLCHMNKISTKFLWLRIDTMPARKFLPDGRNAHLIQENNEWWCNIIQKNITGKIIYSHLDGKGKFDVAITK